MLASATGQGNRTAAYGGANWSPRPTGRDDFVALAPGKILLPLGNAMLKVRELSKAAAAATA